MLENYEVFVAENGWSALERIQHIEPDIILLDILMPELDGFETCIRLKRDPNTRDVPVLFLSALDEAVDKVRGFEAGGVDYITKPIQIVEVLARIRTHITLRNLQRTLEQQNRSLEERVHERTKQLQNEIAHRQRQEEQKHKLLDVLERQSEQLRALTTWLIKNEQNQQTGLSQHVMPRLMHGLEPIFQQLEIIEAIVMALPNTTDRYQIASQLDQLNGTLEQFRTDLQTTSESLQQSASLEERLDDPLIKLSAREREVLQLVVDGNTNTQIAELLYLSEATVRSHRSRLLQKLQLDDTTALIKFALQHNLTTL